MSVQRKLFPLFILLMLALTACSNGTQTPPKSLSPVGESVSEEQMRGDFKTVAAQLYSNLHLGDNGFDTRRTRDCDPLIYSEEHGYHNDGKVLDVSINFYGDEELLPKGCIEVEYVMALWFYITERNVPFVIDGISANHRIGMPLTRNQFTYFDITYSEFHNILQDPRLVGMTQDKKICNMAKIWCEMNGYKRLGTNIQPYTG